MQIQYDTELFQYLKLFEENLGECLPEVRRAEDGLDDDHSSVARIHQQVSNDKRGEDGLFNVAGPLLFFFYLDVLSKGCWPLTCN